MEFLANAGRVKKRIEPLVEISKNGGKKDHSGLGLINIAAKSSGIEGVAFNGNIGMTLLLDSIEDPALSYTATNEGHCTVNATDFYESLNSFPENMMVKFCLNNKELIISNSNDEEDFQTLTTLEEDIERINSPSNFDKEIHIDKDILLDGVNKILFAVGTDKTRPQFLHWFLDAKPDGSRFVAGSGPRFISCQFEGCKTEIKSKTDKERIYFNAAYTPAVTKIISDSKTKEDKKIVIKQANATDESPSQILIEMRDFNVVIAGIDTDIEWPDVDGKVFNADKALVFKINKKDLEYPTRGVMATWNAEAKKSGDIHVSSLKLDANSDVVTWSVKRNSMRSNRKVAIADFDKKPESQTSIHCVSGYIAEILKNFSLDDNDMISFELIGERKPIVFRLPPKVTSGRDITTKVSGFFASLNDPEEG